MPYPICCHRTLMPSRSTWPRGLKLLYWLTVLGLVIGVGQTFYWMFVTREFFPNLTIQGGYVALAWVLGVACVSLGTLGYRRAFSVTLLASAVVDIAFTAFFSLQIFEVWLPDILVGRWQSLLSEGVNRWIYVWNSFCISVNALISYYLLRFEFRLFDSSTAQIDVPAHPDL